MKTYSFWDIPSVMLETVKIIVDKNEEAIIRLINAKKIKKEVDKLVKYTKVIIIYQNR